jgi:acetyl-CoA carboxylase biotin carboxyl carrier protein
VVSADLAPAVIVADADNTSQDDVASDDQDVKQLQDLYDLMKRESLESLELDDKHTRIRLERARHGETRSHESHHRSHHAPVPAGNKPSSVVSSKDSSTPTIKTPLAGVFYRSSSPSSAPYAKEGAVVDAGQTLCIVEAMKVMNEIKAESRCRIVKILAENGRPVTAGQSLFEIEPE